VAALVAATLFGGSVAVGGEATGKAADATVVRPPPSVVEAEPSTAATPTALVAPTAPEVTSKLRTPTAQAPAKAKGKVPRHVDGVPQVKATPGAAKVGDRVRVEGYGFTGEQWAAPNAPLWLALDGGCGLYARAESTLRVTAGGRLVGELTVPARGECRQSDRSDEPVVACRYRIAFSCTACFIGELKVVASPSAGTACGNVSFTPNSDNVASGIVAVNMPCSEAKALVRKVGPPLGFNGDATAQADGFRCVRTSREDVTLPMATYQCIKGTKKVTFTRT